MRLLRNSLLGLAVICAVMSIREGIRYVSEWSAVDSCLDSGGSFDYVNMKCDHTSNHPFVPFKQRHPVAGWIGFVTGLIAVLAALTFYLQVQRLGHNVENSN